jgi:NAD(P)-dependent dehydrogenase (short-subunit alcohol dehydrogenase family)
MTTIDLTGKCVIVTGAGSGLGRAMSLGLAEAGAAVLGFDVDAGRAEATAKEAAGMKGKIVPHGADVRQVEACQKAVETAIARLGGLTGLVNCAGIGMPHLSKNYLSEPVKFWTADPQLWQDVIDVNVRGPFLLARAATPHMLAKKWGRIVNVTTSFNTMIRGANMPYGQSKASLEAASNSWSEDLAGTGVTVNVLVPGGAADTRLIPEESPYDRTKLIRPDVMVAPIRWLMSDLSDGVTGKRFLGQKWDPQAPWQEALKAAGSGAAWPELAAEAAKAGQPVPKGGFKK